MPSTTRTMPANAPIMLAMAMVLVVLVFGGNALTAPIAELIAQGFVALAMLGWLWSGRGRIPTVVPSGWLVAALVLALPLLQLLPLPPAIWQHMPGRALEVQALALVGQADSWRPLSLTPARTLSSLLTAGCGVALLLVTASLDRRGRDRVLAAIVAGAGLTLLVGAAQVSGGDGNLFRFYQPNQNYLSGFQSSHNMAADVLLIGMAAFGTLVANRMEPGRGASRQATPRPGNSQLWLMLAAGDALLALGVILTGSRTGIALLVLPLAAQAVMLRRHLLRNRAGQARRRALAGAAGLVALALVLAILLRDNPVLRRALGRFGLHGELRMEIWQDAMVAFHQYFPWGSGLGSFKPIFMQAERLEAVRIFHAGNADCDYLQFAIEAGVPGIVILGAIVTLLSGAGIRQWRGQLQGTSRRAANQAVCAVSILSTIGMHSIMEFPLRTIALAGMAGIGGALLLPWPGRLSPQEP